jgi:hypothetical protein
LALVNVPEYCLAGVQMRAGLISGNSVAVSAGGAHFGVGDLVVQQRVRLRRLGRGMAEVAAHGLDGLRASSRRDHGLEPSYSDLGLSEPVGIVRRPWEAAGCRGVADQSVLAAFVSGVRPR